MGSLVGGIEAGGTKFVCAVGSGPDDIRDEVRFPTTTPDETIQKCLDFFSSYASELKAIGIGSFGPVDPDPASPTFGYITTTPKPYWANTDIVTPFHKKFGIPVGFDTDVNAAALGEGQWGAAQGLHTFIYLTIGTGVGGGAMVQGQLLHGLVHPEMGHIPLPHDWQADPYAGHCPFHGDCLEGMASGPAIEDRWGVKGSELGVEHPAWALEAEYIAHALRTYIVVLSPQRIILGGGVMSQRQLFPMIRQNVLTFLNGYVQADAILQGIDTYIVSPGLGNRAGVAGAFALAYQALGQNI